MVTQLAFDDQQLVTRLVRGEIGIIPTDTIYGLVCRATDPTAVMQLYALKHRENKPGTVIAADTQQLEALGLAHDHLEQASESWPGPVSVLIPASDQLSYLAQSKPELACRVVSGPPQLLELLRVVGPLLTTSANAPGEPPANTTHEAQRYFDESVDFYVDNGDLSGKLPSTLVRITATGTEVLRSGAGTMPTEQETT